MTTIRVMSETEKAIRAIFPDPDSQAANREDIRRAAEGRRVLG